MQQEGHPQMHWLGAALSPKSRPPCRGHMLRALASLVISSFFQLHSLAGCYKQQGCFHPLISEENCRY